MPGLKTKIDIAAAKATALLNWDPSKHPRGRDGHFIEVGDTVAVFNGPGGAQITTGTVKGGHFLPKPDGRMFIAVETPEGETKWFRPKQIESLDTKAVYNPDGSPVAPKGPLLDPGSKDEDFDWVTPGGEPIGHTEMKAWANDVADVTGDENLDGPEPLGTMPPDAEDFGELIDDGPHGDYKGYEWSAFQTPEGTWSFTFVDPATGSSSHVAPPYTIPDPEVFAQYYIDSGGLGPPPQPEIELEDDTSGLDLPEAALPPDEAVNWLPSQGWKGYGVVPYQDTTNGPWKVKIVSPSGEVTTIETDPDGTHEFGSPYDAAMSHIDELVLSGLEDEDYGVTGNEGGVPGADPESVGITPVEPQIAADLFESKPNHPLSSGTVDEMLQTHEYKGQYITPFKSVTGTWVVNISSADSGDTVATLMPGDQVDPYLFAAQWIDEPGQTLPGVETPHPAPAPKPGAVIYAHPQGAVIYVNPDGSMEAYSAEGKKKSTSATPEKLAAGHGQWVQKFEVPKVMPAATPLAAPPALEPPPTPDVPPAAAIKLPKGKSPKETLELISTSVDNKVAAGTVNLYDAIEAKNQLDNALNDTNPITAHKSLAKAMTAAKLGGKQRARYKQLLDMHLGVSSSESEGMTTMPTSIHHTGYLPPVQGHNAGPPNGVGKTMSKARGTQVLHEQIPAEPWMGQHADVASKKKARIQRDLTERTMGTITDEQILNSKTDWFNEGGTMEALRDRYKGEPWKNNPGAELRRTADGGWRVQEAIGGPPSPAKMPVTKDNMLRAMRETMIRDMVQSWAMTSNDANARGLAVQLAIEEEFNLKNAHPWTNGAGNAAKEYAHNGPLYRAFVRAMYQTTQEHLKAQGYTHIEVERGMKVSRTHHTNGQNSTLALRPASSFTSARVTAKQFAGSQGIIIKGKIPIERIMGSAATGFGCLSENEWVVLGGVDTWQVVW